MSFVTINKSNDFLELRKYVLTSYFLEIHYVTSQNFWCAVYICLIRKSNDVSKVNRTSKNALNKDWSKRFSYSRIYSLIYVDTKWCARKVWKQRYIWHLVAHSNEILGVHIRWTCDWKSCIFDIMKCDIGTTFMILNERTQNFFNFLL